MSRKILLPALLILLFLSIRWPGIYLPYHQDEWKYVSASNNLDSAGLAFAHPPLLPVGFVVGRALTGENNFRLVPLGFSLIAGLLLYLVVRRRAGTWSALYAVVLYAVSFYSVLGSLMIDVDGSVLPTLFLLAVYLYDRWREHHQRRYLFWLALILMIGWLVKLSFILVIAAIVIDFILAEWRQFTTRRVIYGLIILAGFAGFYLTLLYLAQWLYPAFAISRMLGHAGQFASQARNYVQIVAETLKAVFYLSPLLIFPVLWSSRQIWERTRVFWLYLGVSALFYLVVFDFSRGALDKYLLFAVVPLVVINGLVLAKTDWRAHRPALVVGGLIAGGLLALNFLPQVIVPLYPKTEWFSRVLSGQWSVLTPFTGGSGPLGFYISFAFIAWAYLLSLGSALLGLLKQEWRPTLGVILVSVGLVYNAVFAEELLAGQINGNAPQALVASLKFIAEKATITQVLTYNDSGASSLSMLGKYAGRFYAAPQFEVGHEEKFAKFNGQYLVVSIPALNENSFYGQFFAKCTSIFETKSGAVKADVYSCLNH